MNSRLYFMAAVVFKITASQTFTLLVKDPSLTLSCITDNFDDTIVFKQGPDSKGGCIARNCDTGVPGYERPTQDATQDANITEMVITSCNITRDFGSWTCTYGGSTSDPFVITTCSGDTSTTTSNGSEGTKPDNDNIGLLIGMPILGVLLVLLLVLVVCMLKKYFNDDASERQQPDGHEGPQSTPKDPDARNLTTGRLLPPRPDIASPTTGPVDSVNSPRPNGLAPIENPNIPLSIDTLDEQKTDKKPKDKKKKKKKRKDEEQDNPAYVQDN